MNEVEEAVDDILVHYGRLGMKWGVRSLARTSSAGYGPQPIMVGERRGKPLMTAGGRGHPATDEAKRAAGLAQKAKKSGIQSLTNKELKELNDRMNLEQNYGKLAGTKAQANKSKGKKFVEGVMKEGQKTVSNLAKDSATRYGKALIERRNLPLSTAWGK